MVNRFQLLKLLSFLWYFFGKNQRNTKEIPKKYLKTTEGRCGETVDTRLEGAVDWMCVIKIWH